MNEVCNSVKDLFFPSSEEISGQLSIQNKDLELSQESTIDFEKSLEEDFNTSRKTIHSVIQTTEKTLEHLIEVMKATDSPRAFEVGNQLLSTLSSVSKDLLEVHERYKKLKDKSNTPAVQNNTQNNITVFSGTTKELLQSLKELD